MTERMTQETRIRAAVTIRQALLDVKVLDAEEAHEALTSLLEEIDRAWKQEKILSRLAESARYVARQGCSGNARVCVAEPCPACRAVGALRNANLEVES